MAESLGADAPLEEAGMRYVTTIGEREFLVEILDEQHILLDGQPFEVDFEQIVDQPIYSMLLDGKSYEAYVYPADKAWQILLHGRSYPALVEQEMERRLRMASGGGVSDKGEFHLKSPMPGLVIGVPVEDGQIVKKGEVLIVLESMKMQNELKAPRAGVVTRLRVKAGDSVEQHQTMLTLVE
jgi:biotin carboxyl carrier protein